MCGYRGNGDIAYANEVKCSFAHIYFFSSRSALNNVGCCDEGEMAGSIVGPFDKKFLSPRKKTSDVCLVLFSLNKSG
jgi:hypothetical protein